MGGMNVEKKEAQGSQEGREKIHKGRGVPHPSGSLKTHVSFSQVQETLLCFLRHVNIVQHRDQTMEGCKVIDDKGRHTSHAFNEQSHIQLSHQ